MPACMRLLCSCWHLSCLSVRPSACLKSLLRFLQVEHFSIPQVVLSEGCYSGGRVTICALPVELLGSDNLHTWPLRRLEGKVSEAELAEHCNKELSKVRPVPLVQEELSAQEAIAAPM